MNDFKVARKSEIVCFDLTNEEKISGAIFIKTGRGMDNRSIMLPFKSTEVENVEEILSTNSSYNNLSLFCFKGTVGGEQDYTGVKFVPVLNEWPSNMPTEDELEDGIYFNKSGLECRFIYKYKKFPAIIAKYTNVHLDTVNAIALKLPEKIKGLALANGSMYDPVPLLNVGNIHYFEASHQLLPKVEISYLLPANKKQVAVFEFIMKLLAVITIPAIDFFFIKPNKRLSIKSKKVIKWSFIAIEAITLVGMVIIIMYGSISEDKISDAAIFIIGSIIAFMVTFFKEGKDQEPAEA